VAPIMDLDKKNFLPNSPQAGFYGSTWWLFLLFSHIFCCGFNEIYIAHQLFQIVRNFIF
jgi:hypothetical protein